MPTTNGYRLMMLADGTTQMRSLRLTRRTIILAGIAAFVMGGLVILGASRLIAGYMTHKAMASVIEENQSLKYHIGNMTERLDQVQQSISTLAQNDDQLRLLADMPRIDNDVREVGIGGSVTPGADLGEQDRIVKELVLNLDKMEREVQLQKESYTEIENRMHERRDLIDHTPSIKPTEKGHLSSNFGIRRDPFNSRQAHHNGMDISVERGTPIVATAAGKVVFAKPTPGLGKLIVIDHGYGFRTAYGHLSGFKVVKGQTVERGQTIGLTGNTGRSTAPHLHYEVHINDKAVDPRDFFFNSEEDVTALR